MKKGISLIILVVTIVVMIILAGVVVVTINLNTSDLNKLGFAKELFQLQDLVEKYYFLNSKYPIKETIEVTLSEVNPAFQEVLKQEDIVNGKVILYELDLYKAGAQTVSRGMKKEGVQDVYGISTKTGNIYYVQGVKIKDNSYYSLNVELNQLLQINKIK